MMGRKGGRWAQRLVRTMTPPMKSNVEEVVILLTSPMSSSPQITSNFIFHFHFHFSFLKMNQHELYESGRWNWKRFAHELRHRKFERSGPDRAWENHSLEKSRQAVSVFACRWLSKRWMVSSRHKWSGPIFPSAFFFVDFLFSFRKKIKNKEKPMERWVRTWAQASRRETSDYFLCLSRGNRWFQPRLATMKNKILPGEKTGRLQSWARRWA